MPTERRNRTRQFRELARDLRKNENWVEAVLWDELRSRRLKKFKFRRQHPIGRYIVDFYCAETQIVVELDGVTHRGNEAEDAVRQAWLERQGLLVIRCPNYEMNENIDELLELIWKRCLERAKTNLGYAGQ